MQEDAPATDAAKHPLIPGAKRQLENEAVQKFFEGFDVDEDFVEQAFASKQSPNPQAKVRIVRLVSCSTDPLSSSKLLESLM